MEPGNVILELFVQTNPERTVELETGCCSDDSIFRDCNRTIIPGDY